MSPRPEVVRRAVLLAIQRKLAATAALAAAGSAGTWTWERARARAAHEAYGRVLQGWSVRDQGELYAWLDALRRPELTDVRELSAADVDLLLTAEGIVAFLERRAA